MDFKDKVAVVTGGAQGIGKCIADEFQKAGAHVCVIDKQQGEHFVGDISDKQVLVRFTEEVIEKYGHVDFLVNNALPIMKGIDECSYEEFQYALCVGVTAPFYLTKLFERHFAEGAAIINISSSRDRMSQPQTESYTAAKGGIAALTHALAVSLAGKVRVNSVSPGWIDLLIPSMKALMPFSSQQDVWVIRWTLPTWCYSFVPTRQGLSPVRISVSMVA